MGPFDETGDKVRQAWKLTEHRDNWVGQSHVIRLTAKADFDFFAKRADFPCFKKKGQRHGVPAPVR